MIVSHSYSEMDMVKGVIMRWNDDSYRILRTLPTPLVRVLVCPNGMDNVPYSARNLDNL